MSSKLRRLADFTVVEYALLLQLIVLSFGLRVLLTSLTLPRLMSLLSDTASSLRFRQIPLFHSRCEVDRLVTLVDLATTLSHKDSRCLPRSLLLFWLLRARRESVALCLGAAKNMAALEGHAWVERSGIVFGDTPSFTSRYSLLLRFSA